MANIKITQIRGTIGTRWKQKESLRSLGLKKINQFVIREDNIQIRGFIKSANHLVNVETAES